MKTIIAAFCDDAAAQRGAKHLRERIAEDEDARDYKVRLLGYGDAGDDPPASLSPYHVPSDRAEMYAEVMRRGAVLLIAEVPDGRARDLAEELDELGSLDLDAAEKRWRSEGWRGFDRSASPYDAPAYAAERSAFERETPEAQDLDVIEEEVKIGKREVPREGIRVRTIVVEQPVHETVELREEHVEVQREPVNEPISPAAAEASFSDDEFEVTAKGEEVVVGKEARVVERVHVDKTTETRTEEIDETERRQDVKVEEIDRPATPRR